MHHKVKIVLAGLADFTTENNMGKWEDFACKTPGKNVHTIYYLYKKKITFPYQQMQQIRFSIECSQSLKLVG